MNKDRFVLRMGVSGIFLLDMLFVMGLALFFARWAQEVSEYDTYTKFLYFVTIFSLLIVPVVFLLVKCLEKGLGLGEPYDYRAEHRKGVATKEGEDSIDEVGNSVQENDRLEKGSRHEVFISYSHKDKTWLERLRIHLKPVVKNRAFSVWADTDMKAGTKWREGIEKAISRAKVAVLLVSPDFLASDFIDRHELPPLLKAAENEGLTIIWIPISASTYKETEIPNYQAAHDPSKPLDTLNEADQNVAFVSICEQIASAVVS